MALDDGRIYQLAWAAQRAEYPEDADLLTAIHELDGARMPLRPRSAPPPGHCREFSIISGGERKVILVDDQGIPCL